MSTVLLEDADSQLAPLVQQASNSEEVIIVRDSTPIAKLVPLLTIRSVSFAKPRSLRT